MALTPARTAKLPVDSDLALAWGERLLLSTTSPDTTLVCDLRDALLKPAAIHGLFASSVARTRGGAVFAVARHHHANPYKLYALDLDGRTVTPCRVDAPWRELTSVFAVGDRVMVVPGGDLRDPSRRPAWWHPDGTMTPVDLPAPEDPSPVERNGKRYARPRPSDRVDVIALPDDAALVVWFERLYRVDAAGVTPLPLDGLFAAWEPLREGRHGGFDARGRALAVVHDRFVALDRDGAWTELCAGSHPVRSASPGPDGTWFVVCDETLQWLFPEAREAIELSLKSMRLAPSMALHYPKPMWSPARDTLSVLHSRDLHAYDLAALRQEKRVSFDKLAQRLAAARRSAWNRKLRAASAAPIALDALSPHARGGQVVEHPAYRTGVVQHVTESVRAGVTTLVATVMFERGGRQFWFAGDRWVHRAWALE